MASLAGYSSVLLKLIHNICRSPNMLVLGVSLRARDELHTRLVLGGCFTLFYNVPR